MSTLLFDNPILVKHCRARLRRPQSGYLIFVTLVLSGCVLSMGHFADAIKPGAWFVLFFALEAMILTFYGMSQVSGAVANVAETGILDFHRISPLPPLHNAIGFLFGSAIREYAIVAAVMPFTLFCALAADDRPGLLGFLTTHVVLFSSTTLFHQVALLSGLISGKSKNRGGAAIFMFVMVYLTGTSVLGAASISTLGFLTAGPAVAEAMNWHLGPRGAPIEAVTFFGLSLPYAVQSLIYQFPVICFLMMPAVRRMRSADAMLYSKPVATAFLVTLAVLNFGGLIGREKIELALIVPMLCFANCIMGAVLIACITPDRGKFRNHLRRSYKQNMLRPSLTADESSSRSVVIMFGLVTYGVAQAAMSLKPAPQGQPFDFNLLIPVATAVATILHYGFALQFFRLKQPRSANSATGVFLFLFWLLPLLVGGLVTTVDHKIGRLIVEISPLVGMAVGSITSLVTSASLAALFFIALYHEESSEWREVQLKAREAAGEEL